MSQDVRQAPLLLVADRDEEVRENSARQLRAAGYAVEESESLEALLRVLEEQRPDAVLMDLGLGEDAASMCRQVREMLRGSDVQLLVTMDADGDQDLDALSIAGADDFLERPLHPALVKHRLRRLRAHAAPAARVPGALLEPERFLTRLNDRMPLARSEASHIGVLVLAFDDHRLRGLSEDADAAVVAEVTERMRAAFETGDEHEGLLTLLGGMRITRLDGDSFAMMIPGLGRIQDAAKIGGRLHGSFLEPVDVGDTAQVLMTSIGISAFPEDGQDAKELVEYARSAARRARQGGREHLAFHTESLGRWAFERLTLEQSLRNAISNGELCVFYQPRVNAQTRRIVGMEGLVRWRHPQFGLVSPGQFIPLAEETGLIVPVGEWVLHEACRQNKEWRDRGLPPIRVSVNLSPMQFRRDDLFETVLDALERTGLPQNGLEVEVTESMLMNDPKTTIETLRRLRDAGIHISIDDFGTGYSSLSYLKRFPIDALKIDRSFIAEVTSNPDDAAITTAIILMGHSLRLSIVAEGVETESQLEFLKVLQCNEVQGFLISPPVPAAQAEEQLRG